MVFSSFQFLFLFLPIIYGIFLLANRFHQIKLISLWLVISSIAFYAFWNPWDLLPLLISIFINYSFYLGIKRKDYQYNFDKQNYFRKGILFLAIAFNLLFLGYYKYIDTIFSSYLSSGVLGSFLSIHKESGLKTIPLGISFYTFTQIAFLVDCYHKQYEKNDFLNYFLFVSYFPHLVCGPILSFKEVYPQLINPDKFKASIKNVALFLFCFSIGLFKKTVIGDYMGLTASKTFDADLTYTVFDSTTAFFGLFCYALQIYFDFSGYSDMAVGLSYLFGLKIPDNFNSPYQATSVIDHWRRWHISLSEFLKNYVYFPLGGSRCHPLIQYRNFWITMILGGLWHGGSLTFVLWGAYQGILLSINHSIRNVHLSFFDSLSNLPKWLPVSKLIRWGKILFTFSILLVGGVLFRSSSLDYAATYYQWLFGLRTDVNTFFDYKIAWLPFALGIIMAFFLPDTLTFREKFFHSEAAFTRKKVISGAFACGLMGIIAVLCFSKVQYFLYAGF